jgi:hypothetical protein
MKNIILGLGITILGMMISVSGCKKDNNRNVDYSTIDLEKSNTKSALILSEAYSDTLKMYYDTAKIRKNNAYCIKYDKLYHKNDSMFSVHYNTFGDEMYKNGIMMTGYAQGGMMNGGMMNGGMMDTQRLHGDTAMMNGYYKNILQLRTKHQPFHTGIYY